MGARLNVEHPATPTQTLISNHGRNNGWREGFLELLVAFDNKLVFICGEFRKSRCDNNVLQGLFVGKFVHRAPCKLNCSLCQGVGKGPPMG